MPAQQCVGLTKNELCYVRATPGQYPENFVYGGGGAWLHTWIRDLTPVMDIMQHAKRVVILPSSFNNVPELINILDKRFVVFCREQKSFDYLMSQNTGAKIILDHDMALRYGKRISNARPDSDELVAKAKKLNKQIKKLPANVRMFRTDNETAGHYETDIDLSDTLGCFGLYQSHADLDFAAATMLQMVARFDTVHTDRLHVGIAAMLAGVDVVLYDNNYGKISGVWDQSLKKMANVKFQTKKGQ